MENGSRLLCYNLGCGQQFDPSQNGPESCRHHVGVPVFHDAYKGWSCCKKKCTDFTEFLNIKGCTASYHSNVKPPEPEKPKENSKNDDIIVYKAPETTIPTIERPPFDSPLVPLKFDVSQKLRNELANIKLEDKDDTLYDGSGNIPVGTTCKNNNCNMTYEGPETLSVSCTYHPGYPVFHEGLKFWSCCTKRTTDFNSFLQQAGCKIGDHVWFKKKVGGEVKCRLDWHQTGSHVFVTIFGKRCDPNTSSIELSPVRLKLDLSFPEQGGRYHQDLELRGVVDVDQSSVTMGPTKVEVKLRKKLPGSWSKLDIPRQETTTEKEKKESKETETSADNEAVDLSCI